MGLNKTAFIRLKIVVFTPMPSARQSIDTMLKPGFFSKIRKPYFVSWIIDFIVPPPKNF
jgi:hypothetical protein